MNRINQIIGNKIRSIRENKELLQRELAEIANLPVKTVGRVERGEVDVRVSNLAKIAHALNVSIKDLFR